MYLMKEQRVHTRLGVLEQRGTQLKEMCCKSGLGIGQKQHSLAGNLVLWVEEIERTMGLGRVYQQRALAGKNLSIERSNGMGYRNRDSLCGVFCD